jgi:putative chitinase
MMLTEDQLRQMFPSAGDRLTPHLPYIIPALEAFEIDTPDRIAAFLAQLAHESGEYRWMEEGWGPTEAQLGYEGAARLGNTEPGDGRKFSGHGPIQITGRANHRACGEALGLDLIAEPRLICEPANGTASSCWFWNSRKLSPLADRGWFKAITRKINGGLNGLDDRVAYWDRNRLILGLHRIDIADETESVKAFQRSQGLEADGVIGPITWAAAAIASGCA